MDIQELKAYQQSLENNGLFKVENINMCTVFDVELNKYAPSELCDPKEYKFIDMLNIGWMAWQAAKAQKVAVPEGFVLVSREPSLKVLDRLFAEHDLDEDRASYIYRDVINAQEQVG